jgi:hypothetical protein
MVSPYAIACKLQALYFMRVCFSCGRKTAADSAKVPKPPAKWPLDVPVEQSLHKYLISKEIALKRPFAGVLLGLPLLPGIPEIVRDYQKDLIFLAVCGTVHSMKITVRKQTEKGGARWVLDYTPEGGKRIRRFFKAKADAETAANEQRILQRRAGESWLALTTAERADLISGYEQIRAKGTTLAQVLIEWANGTGAEAAPGHDSISLKVAGERWIEHLQACNRRERHIKNCDTWIRRFAKGREELPVDQVTLEDIKDWLKQFSMVTYNSYRDTVRAFFNFCHQHKYVPEMVCDSKRLPKMRIDFTAPEIFTPEQVRKALEYIDNEKPELLGYFVLATFCGGIRPEECDKMTWSMIDLDRGLIDLPADICKDRRPRLVHLEPTALAWLKIARGWDCCIGPQLVARGRKMQGLKKHLGFDKWPHDICRHTFGSYYIGLTHDLAKAALEMGNSPEIILKNYRKPVTPEACEKFWSLTPKTILEKA